MVKIRLKRMGSKFRAYYRIIIADARAPRDGKFIEEVGTYNPHNKQVTLKQEIKNKWLKQGAVPTETVKKLFTKYEAAKKMGNIKGDIVTLIKKEKKVKKEAIQLEEKVIKELESKEKVIKESKEEVKKEVEEVKEDPSSKKE